MKTHRINYRPAPVPVPSKLPTFLLGILAIVLSVGVLTATALQYFDVLRWSPL